LPVCLLGFFLIAFAMRKIPLAPRADRMDWLGAALITGFLAALNIGLGSGGNVDLAGGQQAGDNINFTALWLALVFLVVFIWQQTRSNHPLIQLSLFRNRNFFLASLANFLVGGALFIAIANVPLFINSLVAQTLEQGAWDSGWLLSALTVPLALAAFPGGWMTERTTYRVPAVLGLLLAIFGFGLMSRWQLHTTYAQMVPQLIFTGIGLGFTIAPIAAAVVNAAPETARGSASALVLTLRLVGMTVGVSGETTYGLRRADHLTGLLIQAGSSYNDMLQTSMQILMQVIDETFLIAGFLCILAIIPAILIIKDPQIIATPKEEK
jgi:MFS family permease